MQNSQIVALTGFEPFGDFKVNPSWEVAKTFNGREIASFHIKSFKIQLIYKKIKQKITEIIETYRPTVLILLGQSFRPVISLEKVAINFADLTEAKLLYNCDTRPKDEKLEPEAPPAYFSTLPLRKILKDLRNNEVPAEISYTSGTFACNQIFFHTMHYLYSHNFDISAGFIHVPCLPSQAALLQKMSRRNISSMNLETTTKAVDISIRTTLKSLTGIPPNARA